MRPPRQRHQLVARLRARLERQGFPRLQMLLLVSLTGAAGFVASFTLLRLGLTEMWLRYLAAVSFAYLAFLGLLWVWLRSRSEDYDFLDIPDVSGVSADGGNSSDDFSGGEGEFGGGGASGSFDSPQGDTAGNTFESVGDAVSGADELALPLVVILFVGALLLSSLWIVYSAPILFAELLVDGVLAASLYRRLRGLESQHWLETALKRTVWPFVVTGLLVSAVGWGMQVYAPGAQSIGEVMAHAKAAPRF